MPLLLPLLPLAPLLPPLLAPLLLLLAPLLLPLDVASPPSGPVALVLSPQAMNELPVPTPTRSATHTSSAARRRNMRRTEAGVIPTGPSP
jgi:hypothetical protein